MAPTNLPTDRKITGQTVFIKLHVTGRAQTFLDTRLQDSGNNIADFLTSSTDVSLRIIMTRVMWMSYLLENILPTQFSIDFAMFKAFVRSSSSV